MALRTGATSAESGLAPIPRRLGRGCADAGRRPCARPASASGRSLAELSTLTRVHTRYLTAIEQNDFSILPYRVFSIGYVRAYAAALGLDEQSAVERFKRESPDPTVPLQAPSGIAFEDVKRQLAAWQSVGGLLLLAVVGWNVFQRVSLVARAPARPTSPHVPRKLDRRASAWTRRRLSVWPRPQPGAAPTRPCPTSTSRRGSRPQLTGVDPADPEALAAAAASAPPVQQGLQPARRLLRRLGHRLPGGAPGPQGRPVWWCGWPTVGSCSRASWPRARPGARPIGVSATVDVSEPTAFDVYLNGEYGGAMPALQMPLSQLNSPRRRP